MQQTFTTEQLVGRWEDQRALKNLIGKISYATLLKEEPQLVERFWSARPDICLGRNNGYYCGAEAVRGYYDAVYRHTCEVTAFLTRAFPERMGKLNEKEQYGAGSMDVRPMDTAVIELSGDGASARGIWYSRGTYNDVTPQGPLSFWSLGCFAVDFVREEGQWKILNLLNLTDIETPGGRSWGEPNPAPFPDFPEFAKAKPFMPPEPNVPVVLRECYSPTRLFTPLPEPPEPYETLSDTTGYGCPKEAFV